MSCTDACRSKCPAPGGITVAKFSLAEFPFATTIPDDGTDPGGGYQKAKVNLEFEYILIPLKAVLWYCPFTIGMPLRTESMGKISARRAAILSKEITEGVAVGMDYRLPQGVFCNSYVPKVRSAFKAKYPDLGATATIP